MNPTIPHTYTPTAYLTAISAAFASSQGNLSRSALKSNTEHQARIQRLSEKYSEIASLLGASNKHLLRHYEELQNSISADEIDLVYLQGHIDCAAFLRLIKII